MYPFMNFHGFPPDFGGGKESEDIGKNILSLMFYRQMYFNYFKCVLNSIFKYEGLPEHIEQRNAEEPLIMYGSSAAFISKDTKLLEIMGYNASKYDRYYNPLNIRTLSPYDDNYGGEDLKDGDFVIVSNNTYRYPSSAFLSFLTTRVANIERQIDVNVESIKNPRIWSVPKNQQLAIEKMIKDTESNATDIIIGSEYDASKLITVNKTNCEYFADKLEELKFNVINDVLTFFGISNIGAVEKKERLITAEVEKNNVINNITLQDMLLSRRKGYELANEKFGTDIRVSVNDFIEFEDNVEFREDISE